MVDTLTVDYARIEQWKELSEYSYDSGPSSQFSIWEWFSNLLDDILESLFHLDSSDSALFYLKIGFLVLFLCLLAYVIYKLNFRFFARRGEKASGFSVEEDTIEGIDFSTAIQKALQAKRWREAMRLLYLQTLKMLSDSGRVDWQLRKTPLQYTYECTEPAFRQLTNVFVGVRYGNDEASAARFEEMKQLQSSLIAALAEKGVSV